jgi:hypothetical protein
MPRIVLAQALSESIMQTVAAITEAVFIGIPLLVEQGHNR